MVHELDKQRVSNFARGCKIPDCSRSCNDKGIVHIGTAHSVDKQEVDPITPPDNCKINYTSRLSEEGEHSEWTEVAPKRKNKKRLK